MLKKTTKKKKKKLFNTFLSDGNFSERDYLLVISTGLFFLFVAIGLTMILFGIPVDPMYISLLDMVSPVIMVVVGSIFANSAVETFVKNKRDKITNETTVQIETEVTHVDIPEDEII